MFHDPEIFKTVLDHMPIGIYIVDLDLKVVFWSSEAEKISGYRAADVLGRQCREKLLVDIDAETPVACGEACQLRDSMRDGQAKEADVFLLHRAGHRVPVHVRAIPLRNSEHKIIGAAESFEDVRFLGENDRRCRGSQVSIAVDQCTELPDIASTRARLEECCADFAEHRNLFSVLIAEVDGLAGFTAVHGKDATEAALRVVGRTLCNAVRPHDFVGHAAGGRFIAILKDCDDSVVRKIGERVRKMERSSELEWWGDELFFTVSLGAAIVIAEDTPETLLQRAERAVQSSVAAGGDRVTVPDAVKNPDSEGS
jgi:diguanylate cyclase (GGDEF)-like protein/PAS domain S-box-containing protein